MSQRWTLLSAIILVTGGVVGCLPTETPEEEYIPPRSVCGNDRKQPGERCDGADLNDRSCDSIGYGPGALACLRDCEDFDRSACGAPDGCGDGVQLGVELCDGADLDSRTCERLGLGPGELRCSWNCGNFDTSSCGPPPGCSDGRKRGAELCDGDDFGAASCEALGFVSGELKCAADCLSIDTSGCSNECLPQCGVRVCGLDPVCGASCGTCVAGTCVDGVCQQTDGGPTCPEARDCSGRVCGPDPVCGASCGSCSSGSCGADGQCVGTSTCNPGQTRCAADGYGFEGCGAETGSHSPTFGPRIPCAAGQACNTGSGVCNRSSCLATEAIVLLDRSSSMLEGDVWSWVKEATLLSIYLRDRTNAFGFRQFPSGSGCSVGSLVSPGRDNASDINYAISDPTTGASTPIEEALSGLRGAYGDPNDGQAVILISDGDETCGSAQGAVDQASALFRMGVRVYTIAVTTTANRSLLDQIAQVGGTGQSRLVTGGLNMVEALESIFQDLDACADCTGDHPTCQGSSIHFCDGDDMVVADCTSYGATCGAYPGVGDRCLGGLGTSCGQDPQLYINLCDPAQGLTCLDAVCEEGTTETYDEGDLRLAGGGTSGRLVVYHEGQWGTVCDDGWQTSTAAVACRQLFGAGYSGTFTSPDQGGSCEPGYDPIWLDSVTCSGSEARLVDCPHDAWGSHDCGHNEDVCLFCEPD